MIRFQRYAFPIVSTDSMDGIKNLTTDERGKVETTISNLVSDPTQETRYYIIEVRYGTFEDSVKVKCTTMGDTCHESQPFVHTFFLDAYRINIKVEDQNGEPIENAKVLYNNNEYYTDRFGRVWVSAINRVNYEIVVEYEGKKRTTTAMADGADAEVKVVIPRYDVKLRVVDDNGRVVPADVLLDGMSQTTDARGYVEFDNVVSDRVSVFVRYESGYKRFDFDLTGNLETEIVVDERPPVISSVVEDVDEGLGVVFVSANIVDPGKKASGLSDEEPVRLRYKAGDEPWQTVPMYQTGANAFQATLPITYNVPINYEIAAFDAQGNSKSYVGSVYVKGEVNQTNETVEKPKEEKADKEPKERSGVDLITLIAGVIVFLVVLLIIYKKYTGEI